MWSRGYRTTLSRQHIKVQELPSTLQDGLESVQPRSPQPRHRQSMHLSHSYCTLILGAPTARCRVACVIRNIFKEFLDPCEHWNLHTSQSLRALVIGTSLFLEFVLNSWHLCLNSFTYVYMVIYHCNPSCCGVGFFFEHGGFTAVSNNKVLFPASCVWQSWICNMS